MSVQRRGGQGAIADKGRGEDAVRGTMPKAGAAASPLDARFATQPSAIRTQAIENIRVGQRTVAKNSEVSSFERHTRGPEPNSESWLHLTLENGETGRQQADHQHAAVRRVAAEPDWLCRRVEGRLLRRAAGPFEMPSE